LREECLFCGGSKAIDGIVVPCTLRGLAGMVVDGELRLEMAMDR